MLLYLVDADKLKKVQNILFGKNKHSGSKQSSSIKHSAYRHQHRTKKYPRPATPPQPAAAPTMMPMPLAPLAAQFAGPIRGASPMPVMKHHRMPLRQMKHTHTHKHKIDNQNNQNNQNNNSEPDSESRNLAEVIPA